MGWSWTNLAGLLWHGLFSLGASAGATQITKRWSATEAAAVILTSRSRERTSQRCGLATSQTSAQNLLTHRWKQGEKLTDVIEEEYRSQASPRAHIALAFAHSVVQSTVHRGIESRRTSAVPQRRRGSSCCSSALYACPFYALLWRYGVSATIDAIWGGSQSPWIE
jgi:hypothetical protein